jgi:Flp pilus assembly protein TadD
VRNENNAQFSLFAFKEEVILMSAVIKPLVIKAILGVVVIFNLLLLVQGASAANTIAGRIYDKQRNFIFDVDVELLDEYYRLLKRSRTDSVGYYEFNGLNSGNYTVRVLPYRYDLLDQSQYIEISAISAIPGQLGSSYNMVDFYLLPKKGGIKEAELSVVFAQEIPKEAETVYKKALDDLSAKRTGEGITGLREAVKLFPKYYLALHRLGQELFLKKQFGESAHYLLKAAEVNPRSATSFYYIGYSLYNLGKDFNKAAITALNQAYTLAPASVQILWLLGKVEREAGKFIDAEKHLLQAKKLSTSKVPEIHKELAQLYANDLKKYKEAADELELYLKASNSKDAESKEIKGLISKLREKAKNQFN